MNFKKTIALIAFIVVVCTSCKNKLNILAPYKNITVVYGLIDQNDAIHYIRINKAFEGSGNAYTMAQQYDSIYYPVSAISAVLKDSNPQTGDTVNIPLDTTTSVPLDSGTFSYPKQLLYYTKATLNPNDYYNLIIKSTKVGKILRGSTTLLQDVDFTAPTNISKPDVALGLESTPQYTTIGWESSPSGRIYQMSILFYYDNQVATGPRMLESPLQLIFAQQTAPTLSGNVPMSYSVTQQQLFSLILSSLHYEEGVSRYADSLAVIFTSGTDDMFTYIQLSQPPLGINQDIPSFSDVQNGVGLYTARHVQTFYKKIDGITLDSIQGPNQEPRFAALGFQP